TVLLGGGVHFLHGFQVRRSAAALLHMAKRAGEQGRLDQKRKYLQLSGVARPLWCATRLARPLPRQGGNSRAPRAAPRDASAVGDDPPGGRRRLLPPAAALVPEMGPAAGAAHVRPRGRHAVLSPLGVRPRAAASAARSPAAVPDLRGDYPHPESPAQLA